MNTDHPTPIFTQQVSNELKSARAHHPKLNSLHEGYAVILEEMDELWAEIKKKRHARNVANIWTELVQIAAMAQRTAEDCLGPQP
jgi:hypothetical protein